MRNPINCATVRITLWEKVIFSRSFPSMSRSGIKPEIPPNPIRKSVVEGVVSKVFATIKPVAAPIAACAVPFTFISPLYVYYGIVQTPRLIYFTTKHLFCLVGN